MNSEETIRAALTKALAPTYTTIRPLSSGGMGSVYLADEPALGRVVAIKVLTPVLARDPSFRQRFEREARAAAGISHAHVIQVYTVGEIAGEPALPYIIMQYVDGDPLGRLLEGGPLPEQRARRILREVAEGLAAAHARDLVHRDIKPDNILIERGTGRAFIADFGISAALSPRAIGGALPVDETGVVIGTAPYMSPEQTLGDPLGPASDIYSLGIMAYQMLSGGFPFDATSVPGWMGAHRSQLPAPLRERRKGISDELVALVERCLAKDPETRPAAADLARVLLPSTADEILWPPPGLLALPKLGKRLRLASAVTLAAGAVFLSALAMKVPGTHTAAGWWTAWAAGPVVASNASAAPSHGVVTLWEAVVIASGLALAAGVSLLVALLVQRQSVVAARSARGWRLDTLRDVLADPDGRTGLLLSGAGEFATRSSAERDRLRALRRRGHAALLGAGKWLALVLLGWAASVWLGAPLQPRGGPPVAMVQLVVVWVPAGLALLVMTSALRRERVAMGPAWRRAHSGTFAVPSDEDGGEAAAWYAELGNGPVSNPVGPNPALLRVLVGLVAVIGGLGTLLALGLVTTATVWSGRLARRLGPATAQVADQAERGSGSDAVTAGVRVVAAYRPRVSDSGGQGIEGLLAGSPDGLPSYPVEPRLALGSRQGGIASTTLVADAVRRAAGLSSDTLRLLEEVARHPRTVALRAIASEPVIPLPAEDAGREDASAIRAVMEGNAAGAVLASAIGHFDEALARLGENAAVAEAALRKEGRYWPMTGLRMLHALVLLPLAEVEQLRGNASRSAELKGIATGIAETIDRFGPGWVLGGFGLGGDPRDLGLLRRLAADSTIAKGFRDAVVEASGDGVCLNPREWLAAADPARRNELGEMPVVPEAFLHRGVGAVVQRIKYCVGL